MFFDISHCSLMQTQRMLTADWLQEETCNN